MSKITLEQIMESLTSEDTSAAEAMMHEWFVEQARAIHDSISESEVDESEESEELDEDVTITVSDSDEDDVAVEEADDDFGGDEVVDDEFGGAVVGDEFAGDEVVGDDEAEVIPTMGDDEAGEFGAEDAPVEDRVDELEAQLAALKAEFEDLIGGDSEEAGEEEVAGDDEVVADDSEEAGEEETTEESVEFVAEDDSEDDEVVAEGDDFDDLTEGWELEPVADPGLQTGKEIGDAGPKFTVNDKSPIPQKKGPDRVGGKPVEIKAKEHKGYEREASPAVNSKPLLKNQVKNAKSDLTSVSKEGDKSAVLNKKDGFGSDSPKSPIGAGAADLRGSDFKRK